MDGVWSFVIGVLFLYNEPYNVWSLYVIWSFKISLLCVSFRAEHKYTATKLIDKYYIMAQKAKTKYVTNI